jgi:hypothetical protein
MIRKVESALHLLVYLLLCHNYEPRLSLKIFNAVVSREYTQRMLVGPSVHTAIMKHMVN